MFIVKKLEQYNDNYIYFCDPIKNNIMHDGVFIRILYSTPTVIFNGIYLEIILHDTFFEKYYNKYKCVFNFNHSENKELIEKIKIIEENILKKYNITNKVPHYKIYEHIKNGNIKIFCDSIPKNNNVLTLKISGLWETINNYGLTYKFIYL
jgi:hypothetical protein